MDDILTEALEALNRDPVDRKIPITMHEAHALQQLIVDMHAAHAETDTKNDILMEYSRMFMRHNTQLMEDVQWYMRKNRELAAMVVDRRRT